MKKVLKRSLIAGTALSVLLTTMPVLAHGAEKVTRFAGKNRIETAIKIAEESFKGLNRNSDKVILAPAADANLVDSLTVSPLAYRLNAPILLNDNKDSLNQDVLKEIKKHNIREVYICTGEGVISNKVVQALKNEGIKVIRLGGANRYETSQNILNEFTKFGGRKNEIIVVSGNGVADALSIAPMAAAEGIPILLTTDKNSINSYFENIAKAAKKVFVVGGSGIISDKLVNDLKAERIAGANRYETNLNVIKRFCREKVSDIFIANGSDNHLVDSLTVATLAGSNRAPILLSNNILNNNTKNLIERISDYKTKIISLGSDKVVSNNIVDNILNIINNIKEVIPSIKVDSKSPVKLNITTKTVQKGLKQVIGCYQKTYIHMGGNVKQNGIIHIAGKDIEVIKGQNHQIVIDKIQQAFANDKKWKVSGYASMHGKSYFTFTAKEKDNHVDKLLENTNIMDISQEHTERGAKTVYVPEICELTILEAIARQDGTITVNVKGEGSILDCDVKVTVHKGDTKKEIAKSILDQFKKNLLINRVYSLTLNEENTTITLKQRNPDNITTKVIIKK